MEVHLVMNINKMNQIYYIMLLIIICKRIALNLECMRLGIK